MQTAFAIVGGLSADAESLSAASDPPPLRRIRVFQRCQRARSIARVYRGHMAQNYGITTRYGKEAQRETFYMSNIVRSDPP